MPSLLRFTKPFSSNLIKSSTYGYAKEIFDVLWYWSVFFSNKKIYSKKRDLLFFNEVIRVFSEFKIKPKLFSLLETRLQITSTYLNEPAIKITKSLTYLT